MQETYGAEHDEGDELLETEVGVFLGGLEGLEDELGEADAVASVVAEEDEEEGDYDYCEVLGRGVCLFDLESRGGPVSQCHRICGGRGPT